MAAASTPSSYSETDASDIRFVRRTTERAYRVHTVSSAIVLLLMLLVGLESLLQRSTQNHPPPSRISDCIHTPSNITVPTLWPTSEDIRKCMAQHALFVQLEHFCREINGHHKDLEIHSYYDGRSKLTVTINGRHLT